MLENEIEDVHVLAAQLNRGCEVPLALLPCGAPKVGRPLGAAAPRFCPKAGVDADGRLKAGMLGWEAAAALEAGTKGLAPKLKGCAGAAPAEAEAAELSGMLKRPLEGGARLTLDEPGELLAFPQPFPAFAVGCGCPKRDDDGAAEAALVEAGCFGRLLAGGAKLSGAAAAPEAPAAGRSLQGRSALQQQLPGREGSSTA